jgi:L-threonylcarbamoyladenylate synthase
LAPPSFSDRIVPAEAASIARAARMIRDGALVGMPTETVYGLAADATNGEAVAAIFEAKGRPLFNPLISHVADIAEARRFGVFDRAAERLAEAFWPGPLTLVVPHRAGSPVSDLARAGLDSVALRVPSHPVARDLIRAAGRPLAAPSANRSGRISPTQAEDVETELGARVGLILDGGACAVGLESTVVSCIGDNLRLLRPGGVTRREIETASGSELEAAQAESALRSPGLLQSHYAPNAKLQMNVQNTDGYRAILTFGNAIVSTKHTQAHLIDLSPSGNLRQAASRLFSALRELDAGDPPVIAVTPIPIDGLGEAINDRLARAAAPRM